MSKNAVESKWVEREWQAAYKEELQSGAIKVVPLLAEDCDIPFLLRDRKYVDFRKDYDAAIRELITGLVDPKGTHQKEQFRKVVQRDAVIQPVRKPKRAAKKK